MTIPPRPDDDQPLPCSPAEFTRLWIQATGCAQAGRDAVHDLQAAAAAAAHDPAAARTLLDAATDKLAWVALSLRPRRSQRGGPRGARVYRTGQAYRRAIHERILKPAARSGWTLADRSERFFAERLGIAYHTYRTYNRRYGVTAEAIRAGMIFAAILLHISCQPGRCSMS